MKQNKTNKFFGIVSVTVIISLLAAAAWIYQNVDQTPRVKAVVVEEMPSYALADLDNITLADNSMDLNIKPIEMELGLETLNDFDIAQLEQGQVPEPATVSMLVIGGLGLLARRRKNRK